MLLSLCLLLFGSCRQGSKNDLALLQEASLHTAQPDSVMDLLGRIACPDCLQGKARADYALLYTEALNKQDRIGTDDSLIKIALGYYSKQAPGIPLAKSYFLLGRIYQQQGNDTLALKVNLQALAALPPQAQDRTRMLVNYDLGYLYHKTDCYSQALLHYREMQKYVDTHSDTLDCYITAYSLGDIFMLLNRYDSAYHYYQEAISFARQLENKSYERYIIRQLCLHARLTGNRQQAKVYLQEIVDTYGNDFYNKAVLFKECVVYFQRYAEILQSLPGRVIGFPSRCHVGRQKGVLQACLDGKSFVEAFCHGHRQRYGQVVSCLRLGRVGYV